jgi:flagellar hook assembly protein FlgD
VSVFDAAGRVVRTLVAGEQTAGRYSVVWHGRDDAQRIAPNGIYFVRMQSDEFRSQRKAILLRQ